MPEGPVRSRLARQAAEQALVRVVHHYGGTPGFVLLGGLGSSPGKWCMTATNFNLFANHKQIMSQMSRQ